jgi:hypothetical protein
MSLEEGDAAAAAVAVAPRVSLADLESMVAAEYIFAAGDAIDALGMPTMEPARLLTLCVLVLDNGWTIVGKSAAASPANYNRELGQRLAREDAIRQMWPLEGYRLRSRLAAEAQS